VVGEDFVVLLIAGGQGDGDVDAGRARFRGAFVGGFDLDFATP
jgi:hypothetical protein